LTTFRQLQEEALRYFDLASETEGADVELVKQAINGAHQRRIMEDKWKFMLSNTFTLSVTAGVQEYILPHTNFHKLHYLWSLTNERFANSLPFREVPFSEVSFGVNNDVDNLFYDIVGVSPVKAQPTSADTLVLTTSGAEATNPSLYVEGEDSSGNAISALLEKDETSTGISFAKVTYCAKTGDFATQLTLSTTGGTTLLVLPANEYARQYPIVKFYNIPSSAESFQYRYFKKPRVLTRDFDIPDIPYPLSNILIYDALLDLATYNELDSESVNIWRDKQQDGLVNLYLQKLEGDTVGGYGSSIVPTGA
jgi:hypothetical protein